jgi:osmotically-inducible protein OsmY
MCRRRLVRTITGRHRTTPDKEIGMHKPNNMLEFDIKDALEWDTTIDDRRVDVKADDGHVTLTGSVPSYYDKVRASEDAWSVGGVKALDNEVLVGLAGAAINDADLEQASRDALDRDRLVPKGAVTPTVVDGHVQLRGHVRNPFQRQAAEHAISHLDGVLGIENLIALSPEPIPGDVAERINKAFKRSAIIDDSKIKVTNDGHTIYLTGTVGSYAAMREALDTSWQAPGVDNVVNDLVIAP